MLRVFSLYLYKVISITLLHINIYSLIPCTYNDQGQLTCVLCQSTVRSEAVWTVHVNAKIHKQNVEIAKKLKERTNNFTSALKRPLTPPILDIPKKKIKGILKNSNTSDNDKAKSNNKNNLHDFLESKKSQNISIVDDNRHFDKNPETLDTEEILDSKDILPEGFFDDPKLDAKVSLKSM